MSKDKKELAIPGETQIDETALFKHVSAIIENRKLRAQAQANQEMEAVLITQMSRA